MPTGRPPPLAATDAEAGEGDAEPHQPEPLLPKPAGPDLLGLLMVVGAAAAYSTQSALAVAAARGGFSALQLALALGVARWGIAAGVVVFRKDLRATVLCQGHGLSLPALVALRQLIGCLCMWYSFKSYELIPLGRATTLVYTAPVWTVAIAWAWLGEAVTRAKVLAACLSVAGVALLASAPPAGPPGAPDAGPPPEAVPDAADADELRQALGTRYALLAGFLFALGSVATRKIGARMPPTVSVGWFGATLTGVMGAAALALGEAPVPPEATAETWLALLVSALASYTGQALATGALQRLEASAVNVLLCLEIILSFGWQAALLGARPSPRAMAGAAVVLASAAIAGAGAALARRGPARGRFAPVADDSLPVAPANGFGGKAARPDFVSLADAKGMAGLPLPGPATPVPSCDSKDSLPTCASDLEPAEALPAGPGPEAGPAEMDGARGCV